MWCGVQGVLRLGASGTLAAVNIAGLEVDELEVRPV